MKRFLISGMIGILFSVSITACGNNTIEEVTTPDLTVIETTNEVVTSTAARETASAAETITETYSYDFVNELASVKEYNQVIIVESDNAGDTQATLSMHNKTEDGIFYEVMSTDCFVGKTGIGQGSEYASNTPVGDYTLTIAFGIKENPGTSLPYTMVDDSHYWVDDVNSIYYNKFISTNEVDQSTFNSAEHIVDYPDSYNYCIAIDYNLDCVPGAGSAIFLHCANNSPTLGCVSVSEEDMIWILQNIKEGCHIIIDTRDNLH